MLVLALDTTTRAGSVALVDDDRLIAETTGDPTRSHAERLPGAIADLLGGTGTPAAAVDVFAVASGPGSFTGLRIGIATIQGLAFTLGRRVVPVSALEALAHLESRRIEPGTLLGIWMDAFRDEVFSALYSVESATDRPMPHLREIEPPTVDDPGLTLDRWKRFDRTLSIAGDGTVVYQRLLNGLTRAQPAPALAAQIARIALTRARAGDALDPAAIQPLYVRRPDAETDRLRRRNTKDTEETHRTKASGEPAATWTIERVSSPAQIDEVMAIEHAAFTNPWTREMYWRELEQRDTSLLFLARDGSGRAIGFCSLWRVVDELHINNLAVDPSARRRGVATGLLLHAFSEGSKRGARRATLEVRRSNVAAQQLYEHLDFLVKGVRRDYYSSPVEDALILWRDQLED